MTGSPEPDTPDIHFSSCPGDINGDKEVDVSDAVLLARFCAEDSTAVISKHGLLNADMNQNGTPDKEDVILILRAIAHLN